MWEALDLIQGRSAFVAGPSGRASTGLVPERPSQRPGPVSASRCSRPAFEGSQEVVVAGARRCQTRGRRQSTCRSGPRRNKSSSSGITPGRWAPRVLNYVGAGRDDGDRDPAEHVIVVADLLQSLGAGPIGWQPSKHALALISTVGRARSSRSA